MLDAAPLRFLQDCQTVFQDDSRLLIRLMHAHARRGETGEFLGTLKRCRESVSEQEISDAFHLLVQAGEFRELPRRHLEMREPVFLDMRCWQQSVGSTAARDLAPYRDSSQFASDHLRRVMAAE